MAMTFNQVTLIGHLGADPDYRELQYGAVANLSLATSEKWKDKRSGEQIEKTEWHRVSIKSDALARMVNDYCRKGAAVMVQGKLETRKFTDKAGAERYVTEIIVGGFGGVVRLLESRDAGGGGGRSGGYTQSPLASAPDASSGRAFDDSVPF